MLPFTFTSHVEIMSGYYTIFSRSDSDLEEETKNLKLYAARIETFKQSGRKTDINDDISVG
jgi:hypothetical protein